MVFSSPIFLLAFLPVVLALYFAAPRALKNILLLAASLFFYAWGETFFVGVMLASIACNYLFGLGVDRYRNTPTARWLLGGGIVANLLLLGSYKYANFVADNVNALLVLAGMPPFALAPVHLPIGISFFTFQAMSYLIDVYRREAPARHNPLHVALYISMFPQLIAGPIVRYHQVAEQLIDRTVTAAGFAEGVRRFIIGLGKKVLIANPLGAVADNVFALPADSGLPASLAWAGILCYTLQIYFDFSGYSDMAIGLGRMFGFRFPENFNYPYISASIREFWRRWHISLSSWFRDYLYIPLGGNRKGSVRTHFNLLTVFFLCGLWHGASWNFIIWGLLHGFFLVAERGVFGRMLNRLWPPLRHSYTLLVVMVGWVFFRAETLPDAVSYLRAMAGYPANATLFFPWGQWQTLGQVVSHEALLCLLIGMLAATPLPARLARYLSAEKLHPAWADGLRIASLGLILLATMASLSAGTYNPFIYFRF